MAYVFRGRGWCGFMMYKVSNPTCFTDWLVCAKAFIEIPFYSMVLIFGSSYWVLSRKMIIDKNKKKRFKCNLMHSNIGFLPQSTKGELDQGVIVANTKLNNPIKKSHKKKLDTMATTTKNRKIMRTSKSIKHVE